MEDRTQRPVTPPDVIADPGEPQAETLDARFTHGLIYDIKTVLEDHGYQLPPVDGDDWTNHNRALGQTVGALLGLVRTFEGGDL